MINAGLVPLEAEHEILLSAKEPNLRCRLTFKSTTKAADSEKPNESRKNRSRLTFGVAMIKGHSSYKSIQDLSAHFLLKSWELTQKVCDPIIRNKIISPLTSA